MICDQKICSTTVVAIRHGMQIALAADGQATMGHMVIKGSVRKVHSLFDGKVGVGFAGSTADAHTLLDRFESHLKEFNGQIRRAAIALTKEWRTDRYLRKLEAMLIAIDQKGEMLLIAGSGDVLSPDGDVASIGSGSPYALGAAKALKQHAPHLSAEEMVRGSLAVAAGACIYTNEYLSLLTFDLPSK